MREIERHVFTSDVNCEVCRLDQFDPAAKHVTIEEVDRLLKELDELRGRRFTIMDGPSIPWSLIAPHERQAQKNHDQSLKRLDERGGLSIHEAVAVLTDRSWREVRHLSDVEARRVLDEIVASKSPQVMRLQAALDEAIGWMRHFQPGTIANGDEIEERIRAIAEGRQIRA